MKAGGNGPSHSKRKTTCLYSPAKPLLRSATLCVVATVHIFGIFFFLFIFFFVRAAGPVGHVEGQDPQGYVVLRMFFFAACGEEPPYQNR